MGSRALKHHVNVHKLLMYMENNQISLPNIFPLAGEYLWRKTFGTSDTLPIACNHLLVQNIYLAQNNDICFFVVPNWAGSNSWISMKLDFGDGKEMEKGDCSLFHSATEPKWLATYTALPYSECGLYLTRFEVLYFYSSSWNWCSLAWLYVSLQQCQKNEMKVHQIRTLKQRQGTFSTLKFLSV